jgi:hypothetical protein
MYSTPVLSCDNRQLFACQWHGKSMPLPILCSVFFVSPLITVSTLAVFGCLLRRKKLSTPTEQKMQEEEIF